MADLMLEYRWLYRLRVSRPYIGGRRIGLGIGQTFIDVVASKGAVCLCLEFVTAPSVGFKLCQRTKYKCSAKNCYKYDLEC